MQQQVVRTRPPEGQHIDFAIINALLGVIMFIGLALVAFKHLIPGFALAGWAALSILFCTFRAWSFDRHVWLSGNPVIVEQPEPGVVTKTEYAQVKDNAAGREITYGGIHLEDAEWTRLAQYVIKKGGIDRDGALSLKIKSWGNLTSKVGAMTRFQYVMGHWGNSGMKWFNGGVLTPAGREYFSQFLPPSDHSPTPQNSIDDSRAHEDDDGRTTANGGEQ